MQPPSASGIDIDELSDFLTDTRNVFQKVVDAREVLFREDVRKLIKDSWDQIQRNITSVSSTVKDADSQLCQKLGQVGLSGVQLSLKLTSFKRALKRFTDRGTLKLLEKVLKWINKILGSLMAAIPGTEPIKEFKDAIEEELDDSDPV